MDVVVEIIFNVVEEKEEVMGNRRIPIVLNIDDISA